MYTTRFLDLPPLCRVGGDIRLPGSKSISNRVLLPQQGSVDEAYYTGNIGVIEQRLAAAGARLAQVLNRALPSPPPS